MRAVGVGVGHEDDPAVAARRRGRTCGPEPAPTTWMIEAHSAFFSMSPTEAFWTLRILPRIGSSAWNSELRASLAVPSAESPSTMNSSVRSMSLERQSASLDGQRRGLQRVLAALGLPVLAGREPGLGRAGDLLHDQLGLGLLGALGRGEELLQLGRDHLAYDAARPPACRAPPWSGPRTAARPAGPSPPRSCPSSTSSLMTSASLTLSALVARITSLKVLVSAALEAGDVGAALGGGDHVDERAQLGVVAGAPAQRDVDAELALDVLRGHVALVVEQRHGLGERVACPASRSTSVTGSSWARNSQNSAMPPSWRNFSSTGSSPRRSRITSSRPGHDERGLPGPGDQLVVARTWRPW